MVASDQRCDRKSTLLCAIQDSKWKPAHATVCVIAHAQRFFQEAFGFVPKIKTCASVSQSRILFLLNELDLKFEFLLFLFVLLSWEFKISKMS